MTLILVFCLVLVPLFAFPQAVFAFKQEDIDKLSSTKQCPFCDLTAAELPGADLSKEQAAGGKALRCGPFLSKFVRNEPAERRHEQGQP